MIQLRYFNRWNFIAVSLLLLLSSSCSCLVQSFLLSAATPSSIIATGKERSSILPRFGIDTVQEEESAHDDQLLNRNMEKAWRYVKKPLLSIGAKGASKSHGNSLRQLLEAHTAVKVKINPRSFSNGNDRSETKQQPPLDTAFAQLVQLAEESGAVKGIELLQARDGKEKTILFGMPGTRERIKGGDFPPPPLTE